MKKENIKRVALDIIVVFIAASIASLYLHVFVTPARFAPSGIDGLCMILFEITGLNMGWFKLIINIPLLILAWIFLKKRYVFHVMLFTLLVSVGVIFWESISFYTFIPTDLTDAEMVGYRLMAALVSGVLLGLHIGILLKRGYSSGGVDIIAGLFHIWKPQWNIERLISICSYIIVGISYLVYWDLTSIFLSIIQIFVGEWTIAGILSRERYAIEVKVVTKHPEEIRDEILYKYQHSATILSAKGMYSGEDYFMVVSVMNSRDIAGFINGMKKYPDTFVYFSGGVRVQGEFHFNEHEKGGRIDAYQ
jgi:uncharacterized membrane-anchored protein YitT (DUF2179 family)